MKSLKGDLICLMIQECIFDYFKVVNLAVGELLYGSGGLEKLTTVKK